LKIGHVCLDKLAEDNFRRLVLLSLALDRHGVRQHAIVRDRDLARRLSICERITVGYVVRSPMLAYCLMPDVDVAHVHGGRSGEAGLLLALTRSIPYVITRYAGGRARSRALQRSIYRRAAGVICPSDAAALLMLDLDPKSRIYVIPAIDRSSSDHLESMGDRAAAEHLRMYRRVVDNWQIPALIL
jgi:hypothetical protein